MLYGIRIAEKSGFPPSIIEAAREYAKEILADELREPCTNSENRQYELTADKRDKLLALFDKKRECVIENWTENVEKLKLLLEDLDKQKEGGDLSWALKPFQSFYDCNPITPKMQNQDDKHKPLGFSFNDTFDVLKDLRHGAAYSPSLPHTFSQRRSPPESISKSCNQVPQSPACTSFDKRPSELTSPTIVKGVGFANQELQFSLDSLSP